MQNNNLLNNLNNEQLKAVTHTSGPMLIIAGAGTGKTTVITKRIAWLIQNNFAKPSEILALTFTDKAAGEMDERILELLPYGMVDFTASTFHSFCQEILKDYGIIAGISPDFKLLTETQQILFLRENIDHFNLNLYKPISNPSKFLSAIIKLISRAKDENAAVADYKKLINKYQKLYIKNPNDETIKEQLNSYKEQCHVYEIYERLKNEHNYFDFGDLIIKTLQMLKDRPGVLKKIQNKFKYIFVDEFQDTNYSQAQIIYLLADKFKNITVVGDDDQSIYKFRGASISNIMEFLKYYPKAKKIVLNNNYRSTQEILDASYKLITHNNPDRLEYKEKINKKLISDKTGEKPQFWHFSENYLEVDTIVNDIISKSKNKKFGDFAILIRANAHADDFIIKLKENNIPYNFVGSRGLYDREEIRELISYLKILSNPDDNLALFYIAWSDQFNISKITLRRLTNISKQKNISLFKIFDSFDSSESFDSSDSFESFTAKNNADKIGIKRIIDLIKSHLELARSWPTAKILVDYIFKSGLYQRLKTIDSFSAMEKVENIRLFFKKISEFENVAKDKTLFSFIQYLDIIMEAGDNPATFSADKYEDAVNIMTVHGAKGLEFDTVYLPNLAHGKFPSRQKKDIIELPIELVKDILPEGNIHLEEERRLFYVALTRAKNHLYLSFSDYYTDGKQKKKISQFINETIGQFDDSIIQAKKTDFLEEIKNNQDYTKHERKMNKNEKIVVSPSAIENFDDCPKKFEYSFIFKVPTPQTSSLSFGNSIHNTLRDIYNLKMNRTKITTDLIEKIYKKNWQNDGYISKKEATRAYTKGLGVLNNYIISDTKTPLAVEQKFDINLNENFRITGRIDRIDQDDDFLNIIDYKTGDGRKKTKSEITGNIPLWVYAMWTKTKYPDRNIRLSLNYIINNKSIKYDAAEKKFLEKKKEIEQICENIAAALETHSFIANPKEMSCKYCSCKSICPYKAKNA